MASHNPCSLRPGGRAPQRRGSSSPTTGASLAHGVGSLLRAHNQIVFRDNELADTVFAPGALEPPDVVRIPLLQPPEEQRDAVLDEFLDALDDDRNPEPSGKDNLGSIVLVLTAACSATSGRTPVSISDI